MKNNFTNKTIAVILTLILVFGLIPSTVFAQPNPPLPSGEIRGFNRAVFDSHFSRADRELNPDRWLAEAKLGISQAICTWELIASGLYENPLIFNEAKKQIEKWSNDELEERFSQWLIGRFFSSAAEQALMDLSAKFGETQKNYSWHLDDDGNIVFDDNTGDPLIIRHGEEGREFSRDLSLWRSEINNHIRSNGNSFDNAILRLYPELLAYVPEELRENMEHVIYEAGASIAGNIKREFENIAVREESIFTSRRTRDIWSLRKKSDEESARMFTEKLITETEDACAREIEELNIKIEEASAGTGDLVLLGEEWLQLYKEQFEKGLKAWEEAEEQFFIRRIEWEQESLKLFSNGEETWIAAFNQFEEERKKWELKVKDLLHSGEELFKNISENLEKSIAEAKKEFEANMEMRLGAGVSKVKAMVDMYLICASAAITARESVQFWLNQYDSKNTKNPIDPDFINWLLDEQKKTDNSSFIELKKSYDLYASYLEKALDVRDRVLTDYAELIGTGALKDILAMDASYEDFCLDEYQIALIKSKALVSYWERKTAIAEAVISYADEIDAGRMTDYEGIRKFEEAKSAYNESLAVYEAEIKKLNNIGIDIQEQQKILDKLAVNLASAEEKLNALNQNLLAYVAASMTNTESFALEDLKIMYKYIFDDYQYFQKTGAEAAYKNILDYGMKWALSEQKENAEYVLNILINGNNEDILSLTELQNNVYEGSELDLNIRLASIYLFADDINGKLRDFDSTFSGADWYSIVKKINFTENEKISLSGNKLGEQLAADCDKSYKLLLNKRLSLELEFLSFYLNEYHKDKTFNYELSEAGIANTENLSYFFAVLSALRNRLESGNGYYIGDDRENEIISFFISGGSFFSGLEKYYIEEYNDYFFCMNLLDLYYNYNNISSLILKETWQETNISLNSLFSGYSIKISSTDPSGNIFPDIQNLLNSIKAKEGNFLNNAAQFLLEFDSCFSYIPQWLEIEIDLWKTSLIEYFAAYSLHNNIQPLKNSAGIANEYTELITRHNELYNETSSKIFINDDEKKQYNDLIVKIINEENYSYYLYLLTTAIERYNDDINKRGNEKHWRQYLVNDLLNCDPSISYASSWKEGILADALFDVVYQTNRLNDSFKILSNSEFYFEDNDSETLFNQYVNEIQQVDNKYEMLKLYFDNFINYGKAYEISKLTMNDAKAELKKQTQAITVQENIFNALRENYLLEADVFINIGRLYDDQYNVTKRAYSDIEIKRFEYEKQDAIQRWASTSYLDTDNLNYDDCKKQLAKAQMVFTVLSDLYNNENSRTYDNAEYNALYAKYKQSFDQKIKTLEAVDIVLAEIAREKENNKKIFNEYQNSLNKLEKLNKDYSGFTSSTQIHSWNLKDMITVKNGLLAFSRDGSMKLHGVNALSAEILDDYFNNKNIIDNGKNNISQFEEATRGLAQRMSVYFRDSNKFKQWSLARDYLIQSLLYANTSLPIFNQFLYANFKGIDQLGKNGDLGKLQIKDIPIIGTQTLHDFINVNILSILLDSECQQAWEQLSKEERADLEFYVILTLSDNAGYVKGFSQFYTLEAYNHAVSLVSDIYIETKKTANKWYTFGIYNATRDTNRVALTRVQNGRDSVNTSVKNWISGIKKNLSSINDLSLSYAKSCEKLKIMEGKKEFGETINWNDLSMALAATEKFTNEEIHYIGTCWEQMKINHKNTYQDVSDALLALFHWAKNEENINKTNFNNFWFNVEKEQKENEKVFQTAVNEYLAGTSNITAVQNAAKKAYGNNSTSWKFHFTNLNTVLQNNLALYPENKNNYFTEYAFLGDEIAKLTMKTMENRYTAELASREIEWQYMRQDISDKYYEWLNSAAQILENGRADWNSGFQKMEDAYRQWNANFKSEFNRVGNEWTQAYLAGLEDKEKWLEQAAAAADQASAESLLSLVGTEGERLSRFIDTREPFGIRNAVPEAEALMTKLLQASGIINMANAFDSLNNITNTVSSVVKRGMGGISIWDASLVKTAASDLARKTNAEIADSEARKLARIARMDADEAIKSIADYVNQANEGFKESMDDHFIISGYWRKSGKYYVKDVVKGSTLTHPVISEKASVAEYSNFKMDPVKLKTNIEENELAKLDANTVNALIRNIYKEIEDIFLDIFGKDDNDNDSGKIKGIKLKMPLKDIVLVEDRKQSPGKFGAHIGYAPAVKQSGINETRSSIFYDEGKGELGRLLSDYIYWSVIDNIGLSELSLPSWDKRIWDDSNSSFKSPTIRSAVEIAGTIAVTVVTAVATFGASLPASIAMAAVFVAINTMDDLIFGALDVASGYKSFEEAGFEFGKALAINTVSSAISFGTGLASSAINTAINTAGSTVTKAIIHGGMSTLGSYTTSVATSYISAYDFKTGHYNMEAANKSWYSAGTIAGALGAGVSAGVGNYLGNTKVISQPNQKYLGGAIKLATAASGELTKYGVYTAYNLGAGMGLENSLKKAYDDMGGLTINVANLGAMFDFVMSTVVRNNNIGQPADTDSGIKTVGNLLKEFSNVGLLEVNFGSKGISANFGTGGIDVGGALYDLAKRGIDYSRMQKIENQKIRDTAIKNYGWGDWTAENTSMRIASGLDDLILDPEYDNIGYTTLKNSGRGRTITIQDSSDVNRNAVFLQHEAYRNGIVTDDNNLETRLATLAHTEMALRMSEGGQDMSFLNENLIKDLIAYKQGMDFFNEYVDKNYDSSADYWKLTREGNLEYDGFATLKDADGNTLRSYKEMGLKSDNSIEGALLWLLNIDPKDSASVSAVRTMMVNSGLKHSFGLDPDNWYWKGEYDAITTTNDYYPTIGKVDLKDANMGKTISMNTIAEFFTTVGATGNNTNTSIDRIYGSAISFLNYADAGGNTTIANSMLSNYYNSSQLAMIQANQSWLNEALKNGVNIDGMVRGNPSRTSEFGVPYDEKLSTSSVEGAFYFYEIHTGIDYGKGGTEIYVPGGVWQLTSIDDHKVYYQLYGGDLKMRVQHLNPGVLSSLTRGTIYGDTNNKLIDYPTKSYGSGTGPHVHIDMTRSLPYNGDYVRQFVNPETLQPGSRLGYSYAYMDKDRKNIPNHFGNFNRF